MRDFDSRNRVLKAALGCQPALVAYAYGLLADYAAAEDIPAQGFQDLKLELPIPERFGACALVLDLPGQERLLLASLVHTFKNPPDTTDEVFCLTDPIECKYFPIAPPLWACSNFSFPGFSGLFYILY